MAHVPKHKPGSFTKNFAWGERGFKDLYDAIRSGYSSTLIAVQRDIWRRDSGIDDSSLDLIPINFFLHNLKGRMSVDELVFQAVQRPHTSDFDRLALFAFHLNKVGAPPYRGPPRPALWANEFVRHVLWRNDAWQTAALSQPRLDSFIAANLIGQGEVRVKSRNNYRRFFELAGYLPTATATINASAHSWMASALFLAWDRHILDGGRAREAGLLAYVRTEELHKLLGISEASTLSNARTLARAYLVSGGPLRFATPARAFVPRGARIPVAPTSPATGGGLPPTASSEAEWLDQDGSDETVERSMISRMAQKRNRKIAVQLRLHYNHKCMFCGVRLEIGENRFYSEAAHIKPLGKPHNGPDKTANLLVLCPNHHLQFDRGVLRLRTEGSKLWLSSTVPSDPLNKKLLTPSHTLDSSCVDWHYEWFTDKR